MIFEDVHPDVAEHSANETTQTTRGEFGQLSECGEKDVTCMPTPHSFTRYFDAHSTGTLEVTPERTQATVELVHSEEYERILLDSSYVKRVGQGYQSNIGGPVGTAGPVRNRKSTHIFNTLKRPKSAVPDATTPEGLGYIDKAEGTPSVSIMKRAVRVVLGTRQLSTKKSRTF